MIKQLFITLFVFLLGYANAQDWEAFTDSIPTLSSPRSSDLNGDGVMDIVIGGGTDSVFSNNGVMAYNGIDGSLLWKRSSRDEVFGSAIFQDITADGIKDVIIVGRSAQLLAIDGTNGTLLWDYFPYNTNPADSGLYNFYNPQFINDVDGDTYPDILIANGGDHAAPDWQSNRPPGHLMVISALTGDLIVKAVVPDSAETYCSPIVADIQNTSNKWILYGTGGENFGGNFYAVLLSDLLLGDLTGSIVLASDINKGFIAPAAIHKNDSNIYDIIIQSFDGEVTKISGQTFSTIWTYQKPGTESSAEPVIGNFTGDLTPDILLVLFKGVAPSYNDYYQIMLDGNDGSVNFLDSLGAIDFSSANSVDLNNDGRDEGLYSITYLDGGYFKNRVEAIDFTTNTITTLDQTRTGVNIGSTPLITDLDNDGLLDLIYSVKKDSLNPMGWKGIYVYRHELTSIIPNSGIAWGSYLGTYMDGAYNSELVNCGNDSVISSVNTTNPCNGFADGSISISVLGNAPPYTYLWSNQSTSSSIQNLEAGPYWVQVTDSMGCYELRTINLVERYVTGFGGIIPNTCSNDSNGTATIGSSGCQCMTSNCTYLWDNGVTIKNNFALTTGWNSVIITHSDGCVVVDSVLINSINQADTSHTNITVCDDSVVWNGTTYDSSGTYSYRGDTTSNNYSMSFDGNDDYVNLGVDLIQSTSFTITTDVYISTLQVNNIIISENNSWCIYIRNPGNGTMQLSMWNELPGSSNNGGWVEFEYQFIEHEWYNISFSYDASFSIAFINGIAVTPSVNSMSPLIFNNGQTQVGYWGTDNESFNGKIDNFAIWNYVLDSTEINQYMSCPPTGTESGLVGYWNFEEGSGNTVFDQNSNGNDGTINGATYDANVPAQSCALTNINGCDSTAILNLTINHSNTGNTSSTACDSYTWDGMLYDTTGVYTNTYSNVAGCDSVHTLNLMINHSNTGSTSATVCDSYTWDGMLYDTTGVYTNTYSNVAGCDSVHTLNLMINHSNTGSTSATVCDSYTWDSMIYVQTGLYTNTYTNVSGCDSAHTLDLTINDIYAINNTLNICYGDTAIVGNSIYTSSGTYTDFFYSVNGCDSTITTQLIVYSNISASISQNGNDITATTIGGASPYTYEWNTGEATQSITPTTNGDYWVIITDMNSCESDSAFFTVTWTHTSFEYLNIDKLTIYPNPSREIFNIEFTSLLRQNLEIRIINSTGHIVYLENLENYTGDYNKAINLKEFSKALYFLEIITDDGVVNKKLILQ